MPENAGPFHLLTLLILFSLRLTLKVFTWHEIQVLLRLFDLYSQDMTRTRRRTVSVCEKAHQILQVNSCLITCNNLKNSNIWLPQPGRYKITLGTAFKIWFDFRLDLDAGFAPISAKGVSSDKDVLKSFGQVFLCATFYDMSKFPIQ